MTSEEQYRIIIVKKVTYTATLAYNYMNHQSPTYAVDSASITMFKFGGLPLSFIRCPFPCHVQSCHVAVSFIALLLLSTPGCICQGSWLLCVIEPLANDSVAATRLVGTLTSRVATPTTKVGLNRLNCSRSRGYKNSRLFSRLAGFPCTKTKFKMHSINCTDSLQIE